MAVQLQLRRGTTEENDAFTGALAEVTVDTDTHELRVHDGATEGGFTIAKKSEVQPKSKSTVTGTHNYISAGNEVGSNLVALDTQVKTLTTNKADAATTLAGYGITDGANTSLSNLNSTGKNIADWSTNVSNCLTEIPQDIKLKLSSGTLTLKSGSKYYTPNGAGVFDVVTTTADKTTTATANGRWFYFINELGNLQRWAISSCYSGTTAPTGEHYPMWYDTTNNIIKTSNDYGSTWSGKFSFPIAIVTVSGGQISSIDQVFNGFGYIGSNVFTLPGVKGLYPNGRNEDGTLKNGLVNCTSVQISSVFNDTGEHCLLLQVNGRCQWYWTNGFYYNINDNTIHSSLNDTKLNAMDAGTFTTTSGVISNFQPYTPFHAVDYNDYANTVSQVNTNTTNIALKQDSATALNYSNVTNCITQIPQDIKLELNSNNGVVVQSGTKMYYGDGTYDVLQNAQTLAADLTYPSTDFFICVRKSDKHVFSTLRYAAVSSATNPTTAWIVWFNTTDGKCYWNDGDGNPQECSLPLGSVYNTNGTGWTSIDQVFNGFGFIGSTIFALPGVKGLAPNGRNADGTLKTTEISASSVVTRTFDDTVSLGHIVFYGNIFGQGYYYVGADGYLYNGADVRIIGAFFVGHCKRVSGKIQFFNTRQTLQVVDATEADYVIETRVPDSSNGYTWYRKYKSGWVEQGGYITTSGDVEKTVTLMLEMANAYYDVRIQREYASSPGSTNANLTAMCVWSLSTTEFKCWDKYGTSIGIHWEVKGFAA